MNNNTVEVEDNTDKDRASADDIVDMINNEGSKSSNKADNSESELTLRADPAENDKTEKINVYEQVT